MLLPSVSSMSAALASTETPGWHLLCHLIFIWYLKVRGVEPFVTHQTSWLESTGEFDLRQNQAFQNFC